MKILITGGAGYLGSVLAHHLVAYGAGHEVTALDNFRESRSRGSLLHLCMNAGLHAQNLRIINGDVLDSYLLKYEVAKADAVVHLAAIVGQSACDEDKERAKAVNVFSTTLLVGFLKQHQLLVYPCTNSGYGIGSDEPCTEESPMNPVSWYGQTKVQGEKIAMLHKRTVSLRFATLFGVSPSMRWDLLVNTYVRDLALTNKIEVFEGHFRRNFLHVQDAARAISTVIFRDVPSGIYNVGNDRLNTTKMQLARLLASRVAGNVLLRAGKDPDQRDYIVSSEKFLSTTLWYPDFSFEQGQIELYAAAQTLPR